MKKSTILFLAVILTAALSTDIQAQRYIQLDLLGHNGVAGVSFSSRVAENSKFGYTVGLGYGIFYKKDASTVRFAPYVFPDNIKDGAYNVFSLPMSAYYLFGKQQHFLQVGAGVRFLFTTGHFINGDTAGYLPLMCFAYRFESKKLPLTFSTGVDMSFYDLLSFGIAPAFTIGYRL